jgi:hypothetical protein
MTHDQVLKKIKKEHANLVASIHGISAEVISTQPIMNDWTIKDMLGHVALWYRVALTFVNEYVERGVPRMMSVTGFSVDEFNERELKLRREWSLDFVINEFESAYQALLNAAEKLDDEQLNAQLAAPWEEGVTMERLIAVNSYEHEPEHTAQIKAWLEKTNGKKSPAKRVAKPAKPSPVRKPTKKVVKKNGKTSVRRTNRKTN